MSEILEIQESATYKIGGLELQGNELKHKIANGLRYEKLTEHLKDGVTNE